MLNPALKAYRHALRATRVAFPGDLYMLNAARTQVKDGIMANRKLADSAEIEKAVTHLDEVAAFLIKNIVQGELQKNERYHLKFHEKTELGSNDTIKQSKAEMGSLAGVKAKKRCGSK